VINGLGLNLQRTSIYWSIFGWL